MVNINSNSGWNVLKKNVKGGSDPIIFEDSVGLAIRLKDSEGVRFENEHEIVIQPDTLNVNDLWLHAVRVHNREVFNAGDLNRRTHPVILDDAEFVFVSRFYMFFSCKK